MIEMTAIDKITNRQKYLASLQSVEAAWDIIIIGGGATGLGIALDATARGYKILLLEQSDFAKGTSSRSTKLVHGGVRYLAQGDLKLVREASIERGLLHKNAPHLVKNQTFIVPVYTFFDKLKYSIGLKLYDRIAGKLRLGPSVLISKKETLVKMPGIRSKGLKGGIVYHDGQFDDSRLALNLAQSILEAGGDAFNYMKVTGLLKDSEGNVNGINAADTETNETFLLKAKAVVNATGVFVDDILMMDKPGSAKTICVSQGVHVVIDRKFYPSSDALMIPKTSDGRVLFAVPWHNKVVLGTTDTPVEAASLEPEALEKEISFILETAGSYLDKKPQRSDVLSVFAGLRPLAAPQQSGQKTKEISRSHKIIVSPSHLFTILGGKWTTYRKMGEDMVNRIEKDLKWPHKQPATASLHIHGYSNDTNWNDPLYFYGSDAAIIREQINEDADEWLSEELKIHRSQVTWAVQYEMARTVEDVLSRRTRALLLNAKESIRIAPAVAAIMAGALNKDATWAREQVAGFSKLASQYILK
jgi:glycerol-3-phosphate dehydrogenase